jgi:nicotinate phosphoribosyltransferase
MLTDLYELRMAKMYLARQMFQPATFSLFILESPPERGYYVGAGIESAIELLE